MAVRTRIEGAEDLTWIGGGRNPASRRKGAEGSIHDINDRLAQKLSGTRAQANPDDPPVWMDGDSLTERERQGGISPRAAERKQAGRSVPLSTALAEFYNWSDERRRKWGEHLVSVGRIDEDEVDDFEVLRDEWEVAVDEARKFAAAGKQISPWKAAKLLGANAGATDEEKRFTGRKSFTRKDVNLTSPEDAKGIVRAVLRDQIGRAPTDEEMRAFVNVLNEAERANPQVTTTTSEFVEGEEVSSSAVTTGGLGADGVNELLMEQARSMPDYGAYQAATRLWNALLADVISSPV